MCTLLNEDYSQLTTGLSLFVVPPSMPLSHVGAPLQTYPALSCNLDLCTCRSRLVLLVTTATTISHRLFLTHTKATKVKCHHCGHVTVTKTSIVRCSFSALTNKSRGRAFYVPSYSVRDLLSDICLTSCFKHATCAVLGEKLPKAIWNLIWCSQRRMVISLWKAIYLAWVLQLGIWCTLGTLMYWLRNQHSTQLIHRDTHCIAATIGKREWNLPLTQHATYATDVKGDAMLAVSVVKSSEFWYADVLLGR